MPLMLELKYEYFPNTWPGRIKLLELVLAFFCIVCSAPAYYDSQHWFLTVVVICFLGTIFFSLYYLCLAEPLNKLQIICGNFVCFCWLRGRGIPILDRRQHCCWGVW